MKTQINPVPHPLVPGQYGHANKLLCWNRILAALSVLLPLLTFVLVTLSRPEGGPYHDSVILWRRLLTVLGLMISPCLTLATVITGHIALTRQKQFPGPAGNTAAKVCLICAYSGLVLAALTVPMVIRANITPSRNACINNLRQLDGAKEQWALENHKTASDTPTWKDLIGTDKYIKTMPECERGGHYNLNRVSVIPTCEYPGHTLQ